MPSCKKRYGWTIHFINNVVIKICFPHIFLIDFCTSLFHESVRCYVPKWSVCFSTCMWVCIYVFYVSVYLCVCVWVCFYVLVCECVFMCLCVFMCMRAFLYVCAYVRVYACACVYVLVMYACVCSCAHAWMYYELKY